MKPKPEVAFNAQAFLDSAGIARKVVDYKRGDVIFNQGDPGDHVLYIQKGAVKLSVLSKAGAFNSVLIFVSSAMSADFQL